VATAPSPSPTPGPVTTRPASSPAKAAATTRSSSASPRRGSTPRRSAHRPCDSRAPAEARPGRQLLCAEEFGVGRGEDVGDPLGGVAVPERGRLVGGGGAVRQGGRDLGDRRRGEAG